MKKILLAIVSSIIISSLNLSAQMIEGKYISGGISYTTEMHFQWSGGNATQCIINLRCYDEVNWGVAKLYVSPGKEMEIFRNYLLQVSNKFIEWKKIAIENNVKDFEIEFPMDYPGDLIIFWGSCYDNTDIKLNFKVDKYGNCSISGNGLMIYDPNKNFKAMWYIDFDSIEELSSLYEATNEENYWEERDLKRSYVPLFN